MTQTRLEKEVRLLKAYAVLSTFVFAALILSAASPNSGKQRFTEIDVERLNVIQPDGRLVTVIANKDRLPDPILNGKEIKTGRNAGGMLFFNDKGDEAGGLTYWSGEQKDGTYQASGHFSFDQYNNDQVVFLSYQDDGKKRSSGLFVVDRPTRPNMNDLLAMKGAVEKATGEERARLEKEMEEAGQRGDFGAQRVFVGSADRTAMIRLKDTAGRNRIRIYVDDKNQARMEFLNEKGEVTHSLPK